MTRFAKRAPSPPPLQRGQRVGFLTWIALAWDGDAWAYVGCHPSDASTFPAWKAAADRAGLAVRPAVDFGETPAVALARTLKAWPLTDVEPLRALFRSFEGWRDPDDAHRPVARSYGPHGASHAHTPTQETT